MRYLALLRGINVGGKNKVEMKRLKATFEATGMENVSTYINSGNVIFDHRRVAPQQMANLLEGAIESDFGFEVKVLVRDHANIRRVAKELPAEWANDETSKCDVMFLWDNLKRGLDELPIKPGIDEVIPAPGALLWRVDRELVTRSGMMKIASMPLYKRITIRNCNTVRKLAELMER